MSRAILCAAAVTALGLSIREQSLLKYAPSADLLLRRAAAARRRACAARLTTRLVLPLITLPPVILVPGHRPSHEVKCLTVGKRAMSTPISETTASAVVTSTPSIRVRSTPHIWNNCTRRSNFGALRERLRFLPLVGSPS